MLSMKNIFETKFHRIYVLSVLTFEIVCALYKQGNSSLYLKLLLICQFIIECSDVDDFLAALDMWLLCHVIRFLWLLLVERLLIIHYCLNVSCHYYSFFVNSFNLTFLLLHSVNRMYIFQSKSLVWISIAWNFQSVTFLMQFIKRNFWCHTCLVHFLGNWFDNKVCCTSLC
jgi:hypothetical protein